MDKKDLRSVKNIIRCFIWRCCPREKVVNGWGRSFANAGTSGDIIYSHVEIVKESIMYTENIPIQI